MFTPATLVPNEYYFPDEALAIIGCASVALAERYHFLLQAVLAGVPPVGILRGQKMKTLAAELHVPVGGSVEQVHRDSLDSAIGEAIEKRAEVLSTLEGVRRRLTSRADLNLNFLCASGTNPSVYAKLWG